jgi:hypothetical protein
VAAEIAGGRDAVFEIVRLQHFLQTDGDRVEVAACEATVRK